MTDKVQKIREEVQSIHNLLPVMDGDNISVKYADRICTTLEMYIDSLQEEPVSEDLEDYAKKESESFAEREYEIGYIDRNALAKGYYQGVKTGSKWQKEQMVTKGVDGVVHHFEKCGVASVHYKDPTGVPMSYFISPKGFVVGDKVKVIVIKEE